MTPYAEKIQSDNPQTLLHRWNELRQKNPRIRIRNAAKVLKVSETELLVTGCGSTLVTRLKNDWSLLLDNLKSLGSVMILTRNDHAVHEKTGVYNEIKSNGNKVVVSFDTIDIRLMLEHWHFAFSVKEITPADPRYSLQFFDASGVAIHKIYLTNNSNRASYSSLINKFRSSNQSQKININLPTNIEGDKNIDLNKEELRIQWRYFKQTHNFEKMLNQFQLTRFEALALAGSEFVTRIEPKLFQEFMQTLTKIKLSIMLLVKNKGAVQIHKGAINNLKITGPWLNILDDDFSLHIDQEAISNLYVVEKPATVGKLTSLELYDVQGNNIALISGEYRLGLGEDPTWHDLVMSLPEMAAAA